MYNFHFAKIVAGVGPLLAKETILSKVINMVDVFRISLSGGFDDNNKKYIETILKLDNSKTIMMETRGADLRVKNTSSIVLKKKDIIFVDYSEYAQEGDARVYIDYAQLDKIPVGTIIRLRQSGVLLEMKKIVDDQAECVVLQGGTINPYDRVVFDNFEPTFAFLTERDKKDLQR
jgi:pyruvate kinase